MISTAFVIHYRTVHHSWRINSVRHHLLDRRHEVNLDGGVHGQDVLHERRLLLALHNYAQHQLQQPHERRARALSITAISVWERRDIHAKRRLGNHTHHEQHAFTVSSATTTHTCEAKGGPAPRRRPRASGPRPASRFPCHARSRRTSAAACGVIPTRNPRHLAANSTGNPRSETRTRSAARAAPSARRRILPHRPRGPRTDAASCADSPLPPLPPPPPACFVLMHCAEYGDDRVAFGRTGVSDYHSAA
jgi:hypothetical protein